MWKERIPASVEFLFGIISRTGRNSILKDHREARLVYRRAGFRNMKGWKEACDDRKQTQYDQLEDIMPQFHAYVKIRPPRSTRLNGSLESATELETIIGREGVKAD